MHPSPPLRKCPWASWSSWCPHGTVLSVREPLLSDNQIMHTVLARSMDRGHRWGRLLFANPNTHPFVLRGGAGDYKRVRDGING